MVGKTQKQKPVNLALQGGGAHGAFTWGVLDALLEDGRLDFDGITATSAGAMNAAALAHGKTMGGENGNEKAREVLEEFWRRVAVAGGFYSPVKESYFHKALADNPFLKFWGVDSAASAFNMFDVVTHAVSPYQFNPLNLNPLRDIVEDVIDFDEVHACDCVKLFITATNVQTGTGRVFKNEEITTDVLMASAALPFLFQAVEIDGQAYWDGGYMGNPSLWPLFYESQCADIILVHVNPIKRKDIPKEAYAIENRLNEITFNASLLKELRAVDFVKRLVEQDMLKDEYKDHYTDILMHAIGADEAMADLSISSKYDTDWSFLQELRDMGRSEAKKWLKAHYKDIGARSSVDIQADYLKNT